MSSKQCIDRHILSLVWVLVLAAGSGCQTSATPDLYSTGGSEAMGIEISSSAFSSGGDIPNQYTCDGEDLSPPLSWSGVPDGTESLVLIVDDPDAPARTWVHWVVYDLPGDLPGLEEDASGVGTEGKNDFGRQGYGGPCPPRGPAHRYFFKLYALDTKIGLPPGAIKAKIEQAMVSHILDKGELIGRYARQTAR